MAVMEKSYTCDSCDHERAGETKKELIHDGWVWHVVPKSDPFVMCDECEDLYEQRRLGKKVTA